jgi:hypothetical protein
LESLSLKEALAKGYGMRTDSRGLDMFREVLDAATDALLLAQCDVLVGKFSSALFRSAYALSTTSARSWTTPSQEEESDFEEDDEDEDADALAAAEVATPTVCLKPFVSLDAPWCGDAGVRAGRGLRGEPFEC